MSGRIPSRSEIPLSATWNLASIFPTDDAFEQALAAADQDIAQIVALRSDWTASPASIAATWEKVEALRVRVGHVAVYGRLGYTTDTTDATAAIRSERAGGVYNRFASAVAWFEPDLLALGTSTLSAYAETAELAAYAQNLRELARRAPYVKDAAVEAVIAEAGTLFGASKIHAALADSDLNFGAAEASDGSLHEIGQGTINRLLTDDDRSLRQSAWEKYADAHSTIANGLSQTLLAGIKQNCFTTRVRGYDDPLHASLERGFIPTTVFHNLIDVYKRNLPTWHRYWNLRKNVLGLESFQPWDARAPLSKAMPEIPYKQAVEWIADGMAPMGQAYVDAMVKGSFDDRWVDIYPNKGKRMGAFSSGTHGTNPFIMMSYNDDIFSLSTLAHELGHSMHSYLSRQNQPSHRSGYGLFVAEVASNLNQALVRAHLLERFADDRDMQIAILEEAMANYHRYFFIMPTLARFELDVHNNVFAGGGLSAKALDDLLAGYFEEGFGPDVPMSPETRRRLGGTWMQFSTHMYSNFYVYQYATGISGANALADAILTEGQPAVDRVLQFLSTGGNGYPLDVLAAAGADLTTTTPIETAFGVFASYVDRLENLLINA